MYNIIIHCDTTTAVIMKLIFHVGFIEHPVRLLKICK